MTTRTRGPVLAPALDATLARQRAFSEVLSLLTDHEHLPARDMARAVCELARSAGATPDPGRELAACRQRLDDVLDALAAIEDRLGQVAPRG